MHRGIVVYGTKAQADDLRRALKRHVGTSQYDMYIADSFLSLQVFWDSIHTNGIAVLFPKPISADNYEPFAEGFAKFHTDWPQADTIIVNPSPTSTNFGRVYDNLGATHVVGCGEVARVLKHFLNVGEKYLTLNEMLPKSGSPQVGQFNFPIIRFAQVSELAGGINKRLAILDPSRRFDFVSSFTRRWQGVDLRLNDFSLDKTAEEFVGLMGKSIRPLLGCGLLLTSGENGLGPLRGWCALPGSFRKHWALLYTINGETDQIRELHEQFQRELDVEIVAFSEIYEPFVRQVASFSFSHGL